MSKNQKLYITISLILIGTWLYATPFLTLYSMKKAAFNKELMKDSDKGEDGLGNLGKVFGIALAFSIL